MTRVIFWTLITLLANLNLAGQMTTTPEEFFAHVKAGEPAFVQFDKSVSILFFEERVPNTFYYETLKRGNDWFFLSYNEQYDLANQVLCQCELEELQLYFSIMERQYLADKMWGVFAPDTLGQNFQLENCLLASQLEAFLPEAPVIEKYLNGQNPPPIANGDSFEAEVKAEMILREDGHWLLDLSGETPDSLQILEIKNPQLHYLRTAEKSYYPTIETASWQADLIKEGHFTTQLQGYPEAIWDNDLGKHRSYPVDNPQQEWNVQFNLRAADEQPTGPMETAGSVGLLVSNGQLQEHADSLDWFEAGKSYTFKITDMGTLFMREAESTSALGYGLFMQTYWQTAAFINEMGDTLAQFKHDQAPFSVTVQTDAALEYELIFTTLNQRLIRIPFQQECSSEALVPLFSLGEAHFKRYKYEVKNAEWGTGYQIAALYDVFAPHHSSKDSFRLTAAYDNTGKNLLLAQSDSIDRYNRYVEDFGDEAPWWIRPTEDHWRQGFSWEEHVGGDPRPHYHLEVRLWDKPESMAPFVYLEGELHYQDADGSWQTSPWRDSLFFGLETPVTDNQDPIIIRPFPSGISTHHFTIGDAYSNTDQGLEARYSIPVPEGHSFVQMDHERSRLRHLMDDSGYDLLEMDRQMEHWNKARQKGSLNPSSSAYTNLRVNRWGMNRTKVNSTIPLIVQTRSTPMINATKVAGQVHLVYDCTSEEEIRETTRSFTYNQQEVISLEIDGHIVEFERFIREEIGGVQYRGYNLKTDDQTIFVVAVAAKNGEEPVSPNPELDYDLHNLYIPEDLEEAELSINIFYLEMHQHEELLDIEVSMKGTLGY